MDWGSLVRAAVSFCNSSLGETWPRTLCLTLVSFEAKLLLLQLQQHVEYVIGVLCDEDHWAMLALKTNHPQAFIFDGLQRKSIRDQAEGFLEVASAHYNQKFGLNLGLVHTQCDSWSCGHRLLCSLRALLCGLPVWPPELPDGIHSESSLKSLCLELDPPQSQGVKKQDADADPPAPKKPKLESDSQLAPVQEDHSSSDDGKEDPPEQASEPISRKRAKKLAPVQEDHSSSDDEKEDPPEQASEPVNRKRAKKQARPKAKRQKKDLMAQGLAKAQELGIDANYVFQKAHKGHKNPAGHWGKFLEALARNNILTCPACRDLRTRSQEAKTETIVPAAPEEDAPPQEPPTPVPVDQPRAKRGRPARSSSVPMLLPWVQAHRQGVYSHLSGCRYWCVPCAREVYFVREALSAKFFLEEHEKSKRHQDAVANMPKVESSSSSAVVPMQPCPGHVLGQPGSALQSLEASTRYWIDQGMLQFKSEASQPSGALSHLVVVSQGDTVTLRHRDCKQELCAGVCSCCARLVTDKSAAEAIANWSRRLDMASLVYRCAFRKSTVQSFLEEMTTRDYMAFSKSCRGHVQRCIEIHNNVGLSALHDHAYRIWACLPGHNLTQQLRRYMELNILGVEMAKDDSEQDAYDALCQRVEGAESQDELHLAAWVASGKLKKHTAVHALVSTFVNAQRKRERGCQRIGSSLDEETRLELMFTLGRSKAALDLQELFHVSTKGWRLFRVVPRCAKGLRHPGKGILGYTRNI